MNILIFSNSIQGRFGYSNVFGEVAKTLAQEHNVCYFGMQEISPPWRDENNIIRLGLRYDAFGSDMLENIIRAWRINVLLTGMDVWLDNVQYIPPLCKKYNTFLLSHTTVNSYPLSPLLGRFCDQANLLVAPSKFAESTLKEIYPQKTFRIPHGVDTSIYKPLDSGQKEEVRNNLRIGDKEFVLLSVMRNKSPYQKNFPVMFHAWKILIENNPELRTNGVLLCLTDPVEQTGMRLDLLRELTGLKDSVRFVCAKPTRSGDGLEMTYEGDGRGFYHNANYNFSAQEMCRLYNVADAHVVCSYGESFNLPTLESMACGIPQINAEHTTGPELVGEPKTGLLAKVRTELTTPLITDSWIVDPESLADCMERIYQSDTLREKFSKNALNFAKNYEWSKIHKKWQKLVDVTEVIS